MARVDSKDQGLFKARKTCKPCRGKRRVKGVRCEACQGMGEVPCPKCQGAKCAACDQTGRQWSGKWGVRWTYLGKDHKRVIGSKARAQEVYRKLRTDIVEGTYLPRKLSRRDRTRVADAILTYLEESKATKRTWKDDARYGRVWTEVLGARALVEVRPDDIETWRRTKGAAGAKPATVNRHVAFLKRVFNVAMRDGRCDTNPVARVKMFVENNWRIRFLTIEEEATLRAVIPERFWHYVELAVLTGLRQDEQLSLRWENVDFANGVLTIPRSKHGERRHVPMSARVREILRERPSRLKSPLVYPGKGEGHLHHSTLRTQFWNTAQKSLPDFRWHDLRHTAASRLVMAGVDLRTVQELMGHKTITVTQRYAHLAPSHLSNAMERLAEASRPVAVPEPVHSQESPGRLDSIGRKAEGQN